MQEQHGEFSLTSLCRLLEVSRSGYYKWRSRPPRTQAEVDQQVHDKVQHYLVLAQSS